MVIRGDVLRARRKALHKSAESVAAYIGCCRTTLFRYESGAITKMPYERAVKLGRVLGLEVGQFMEE